jgi:hypothetical protein
MASSRWPQFCCVQANPLSHNRRRNDEHHGVSQDARAVMHRATEMKVTLNHREGHTTWIIHRSSVNGWILKPSYVKTRPTTTETERVRVSPPSTKRATGWIISCRAPPCEPSPPLQHALWHEPRGPLLCEHGVPPFRDVRRRDAWRLPRGGGRHA